MSVEGRANLSSLISHLSSLILEVPLQLFHLCRDFTEYADSQFFNDKGASHEQLGDAHQEVSSEGCLHGHEFYDFAHVKATITVRHRNINLKSTHSIGL